MVSSGEMRMIGGPVQSTRQTRMTRINGQLMMSGELFFLIVKLLQCKEKTVGGTIHYYIYPWFKQHV